MGVLDDSSPSDLKRVKERDPIARALVGEFRDQCGQVRRAIAEGSGENELT
jgi:hypothetical protein